MADSKLRLQFIMEALDKVTGPLKNISGGLSATSRDLAKTQEQLRKFDKLQKQIDGFKAKEARYAADIKQSAEATKNLQELRAKLAATENPTRKLRTEFEKAERETSRLARAIDAGGEELQQMSAKLSDAGIDVSNLARHEDDLANSVYDTNQALKKQQDQLEKIDKAKKNSEKLKNMGQKSIGVGAGMTAAGVAIGLPIVDATKKAAAFETAMVGVKKRITFETPEGFAQFSDDILELSTRVPIAAEGLANIASFGAGAKVPESELLQFTESAAVMGVAFETSAERAGEMMAQWRAAFGMGQGEVETLANKINALVDGRGGDVEAVSGMVSRIGSLGEVAGAFGDEVAAIGHVMSQVGIAEENASTGIKNLLLGLNKGEGATKAQQRAFQKLGLDAVQMAKDMQTNAGGAITNVLKRISALPEHARTGLLTQLFGSESVTAIAPMLTKLELLEDNFKLIGDGARYAGSMQAEFAAATEGAEAKAAMMGNAVTATEIKMGRGMLPVVNETADQVNSLVSGMGEWISQNPALAKGIVVFTGAIAVLLVLIGGLLIGFGMLAVTAAVIGIGLGPLLLIIAAIAAVAAGVFLIYDNWGAIMEWLKGFWETVKSTALDAIAKLIEVFLSFTPLGLIIGAMEPVVSYLRNLDFAALGRDIINGLIKGFKSQFPNLSSTISWIGDSITGIFSKKMDINSPSRVFAALGGDVIAGLDQGLTDNANSPISRITDISAQITRALAIGAGGAAMAASTPALAGNGGAASASPAAPATTAVYNITVNGGGGNAQDIADQVRAAIEQIERERRGRGFGDD